MENSVTLSVKPCSIVIPTESIETVIEEGPRICPLCASEIRLFYIHFNEKMLMCENTECEFPFGHEEVQLVRVENDDDNCDSFLGKTKQSMMSPSRSSIMSTAAWSEIDKMNNVNDDLEEIQLDIMKSQQSNKRDTQLSKDTTTQIQKHDKDLKGLDMDLMNIQRDIKMINNEKWIKNLMSLQGISGKPLLKPQELINLNKRSEQQKGELKIDIEKGDTGMSSITIHLANKNNSIT